MSSSGLFGRLYGPLIEVPENLGLRRLRQEALRGVRGRVLELGIGTGRNLPLYPPVLEHLARIDPDEAMLLVLAMISLDAVSLSLLVTPWPPMAVFERTYLFHVPGQGTCLILARRSP